MSRRTGMTAMLVALGTVLVPAAQFGNGAARVPAGRSDGTVFVTARPKSGTRRVPHQVVPANIGALPSARHTVVYRTAAPLAVDGHLDEPAWDGVQWSDPFVDIEGPHRPAPRFETRQKMLWDDDFFYVAADMEEPDLWGTLTEREAVIYQDNDFEVFIDPDGDTHNYYELEVNVLGTEWDLILKKPYRDGGPADNGWDIDGLEVGIDARGTINRPGDTDDGWTIEIAMPWSALVEFAPEQRRPRAGDQWRLNFSRVQWQLDVANGAYTKRRDPSTDTPLPEHNWVWSPQGAINMHMPERWGYAQFSDIVAGAGVDVFRDDPNERVKWALRRLYYRQREHRAEHGRYADDLTMIGADDLAFDRFDLQLDMTATGNRYEIRATGPDGVTFRIREDGRSWN